MGEVVSGRVRASGVGRGDGGLVATRGTSVLVLAKSVGGGAPRLGGREESSASEISLLLASQSVVGLEVIR